MKNIHILSTDKPSWLVMDTTKNKLYFSPSLQQKTSNFLPKNIYITSDEEIKEGDWTLMFDSFGHLFLSHRPQQYLGIEKGHHLNRGLRKIILTTDKDLIKDGVQSIHYTFLEWFVNNPSCEEVEVIKGFADSTSYGFNFLDYKIIIPKEEPKQERMYSEEEVQVKLYECLGHFAQKHNIIINGSEIDQWFKQFKKK